ncbi:protein of unknown function [Beijerinckiaceae bacterium RH AL1]|nr:hypothetical protein [Beijerinckiaceae bacterium]VVB42143.1 protein of unknown function [Beijerinckiaceae bacterium RH AL8]VVB42144.1 protein of unknown function [Beijerinckiaceae bacterium RH CH11]VVC53160.1 protein of unknown function [Beijerinckiaceae bacterium RH AL1]
MHAPEINAFRLARVYRASSHKSVAINETGDILIRSDIDMQGIRLHFVDFHRRIFLYLVDMLSEESRMKGSLGQPIIAAFQGNMLTNTQGVVYYHCARTAFTKIPQEAWELGGCRGEMTSREYAKALLAMSVDAQRTILSAAIGQTLDSLRQILTPKRVRQLTCPALDSLLLSSDDVSSFVVALYRRAEEERMYFSRSEGRDRPAQQERTLIYDAFIFYLADRLILLRPYRTKAFYYDKNGIDQWVMSDATLRIWRSILDTFTAHREDKDNYTLQRKVNGLKVDFLMLLTCSTVRTSDDLSSEMFGDYIAEVRKHGQAKAHTHHVATIYAGMRALAADKSLVPIFANRRKRNFPGRFPWVNVEYTPDTKFLFPLDVLDGYKPTERVIAWADVFANVLPTLETKTISGWHSAITNLLSWLYVNNIQARKLSELRRVDINDSFAVENSMSFRSFLIRRGSSSHYINTCLSRICEIFDRILFAIDPVLLVFI